MDKGYTVNTEGNNVSTAKEHGFHAYHASGVTAIEVRAKNKAGAAALVRKMGLKVLYVFE